MIRKLAAVLLLTSFLLSLGSAQMEFNFPNEEVNYGESTNLVIDVENYDCVTGADCSSTEVEICGVTKTFELHTTETGERQYQDQAGSRTNPYGKTSINVPRDYSCPLGEFEISLTDPVPGEDTTHSGGSLDVQANSGSKNYAPYLYIQMETGVNPHVLHAMFLTNQEWSTNPSPQADSGVMMIRETDTGPTNERGTFKASDGIIESKLSSVLDCDQAEMDQGGGDCQLASGGGTFQDGNCDDDPCSIATKSFTDDNQFNDGANSWLPNDISPIHAGRSYQIQGSDGIPVAYSELAVGAEEVPAGQTGRHGFWLCRDGSGGQTVDTNTSYFEEGLYRCYTDGSNWNIEPKGPYGGTPEPYSWVSVQSCEDGVDNNDDGETDLEDDICSNNREQAEIEVDCTQPVVAKDSSGNKAAFYDPVSSVSDIQSAYSPGSESPYSSCDYNQKQQASQLDYDGNKEPVEFGCTETVDQSTATTIGAATSYGGPSVGDADSFCADSYNEVADSGGFAQDPMPAVQYFVPLEAIPTGPEWANENGFVPNTGFQTLHQAEMEYKTRFRQPHEVRNWADKNMQELDGYHNDNPDNFETAWLTANAGDINDNVYSEGTMGDYDTFAGGFAGKCQDPKVWTYVGEDSAGAWECDFPAEAQAITVNTYALQSTEIPGNYAGLQINASEIQKWEGATGVDPEGVAGSEPLEAMAECWHGPADPQDMPTGDNLVKMSTEYTGGDMYLVGEMPSNSNVEQDNRQYACTFGLRQKINDADTAGMSGAVTLYENGGAPSSEGTGYIVEGTNGAGEDPGFGRISTETSAIQVPYPGSYYDQYDNPEQQWLGEKAGSTTTLGSGEDPYTHFPQENTYPGQTAVVGPYQQNRHPRDVFLQTGN
ncbi:MAG: hypothetical protein ACI9LV_000181 [Candidatus Nanohaloarchaea archaeon]|jgi:hypothetical protein